MSVELVRALPEQAPILTNLMELYCYDFSELIGLELGPDGRFGYEALPLYWTEPDRHPFLVAVDGHWVGFALVQRGSEVSGEAEVWDMAEFFIARAHRRRGIGMAATEQVWQRFRGYWEVRVRERNVRALAFWQIAVEHFTGCAAASTPFEKDGEEWRLFRFPSGEAGD